jgi:hypothetical protein
LLCAPGLSFGPCCVMLPTNSTGSPSASAPGYHHPRHHPRNPRPTRRRRRCSLRRGARAVFSSSSSTPTLRLALRSPPRRAPGPSITHPLRRASISRASVPVAAAATLALATPMPTVVEPLPHGEAAHPPSAPHVHIVSPACRGYITHPRRPVFGGAACVTIRL